MPHRTVRPNRVPPAVAPAILPVPSFDVPAETTARSSAGRHTLVGRARVFLRRRAALLALGALSVTCAAVAMSQGPASTAHAETPSAGVPVLPPAMVTALVDAAPGASRHPAVRVEDLVALANVVRTPADTKTAATLVATDRAQPASASDIAGGLVRDAVPATPRPAPVADEAPRKQNLSAASRKRVLWMEVTAYCPCTRCCGDDAQGITASGKPVSYNRGRFVAADTRVLPFGTRVSIPGYHGGRPVEVIDRGGAIKGQKLDVYFASHSVAKEWGRRWVPVTVHIDDDE